MSELEIKSGNIIDKIVFLDGYLSKYSSSDVKSGKGIEREKIDEDALVDLSEEFEDKIVDEKEIQKAVKRIFAKINTNGDGIGNSELLKFQSLLEEIGLTPSEIIAVFEEYGIKLDDDLKAQIENNAEYSKAQEKLADEIEENKQFQSLLKDLKNVLTEDSAKAPEETSADSSSQASLNTPAVQPVSTGSVPMASVAAPSVQYVQTPVTTTTYTYEPIEDTAAKERIEELKGQISELKTQKSQKEGELKTAKEDLAAAKNAEEPSVKEKKEAMDSLEKEYKELLETNAEKDPVVAEYKRQLEDNEASIKENDKNLEDEKNKLSEKEDEISNQNSLIEGLKSEKRGLEAALSNAKSIKQTDENKSQVQAKIRSLTRQIREKERQIEKETVKLNNLKDDKKEIEDNIKGFEDTKTELEDEKQEIEKNIEDSADSATKAVLKAFQAARKEFEDIKQTKIDEANETIKACKDSISEIEAKINKLYQEQVTEENKVKEVKYEKVAHTTTTYVSTPVSNTSYSAPQGVSSVSSAPAVQSVGAARQISGTKGDFDQYNAERGQKLASVAQSLYGGISKGNSRCAAGVSNSIAQAFGYRLSGNGCDYGNVLAQRSDWVEITDQVNSAQDLLNLPAGAVVSWSPYNTSSLGRIYGHVYICDGQGHGLSDFKENITSYYMDRNAKWRVFIPI